MPSTPSTIGNVEQIGIGEQLSTWGVSLNACIDRLTEMGAGVTSISLTGNKTLTTTNYVANESRWGGIRFTDGGLSSAPTVTFPAETRSWLVINTGSTYAVNCLAAGSGVSAVSVAAGKWAIIDCDGTDMFIRDLSTLSGILRLNDLTAPDGDVDLNSQKITSLADPTSAQDAATKNYIDTLAASSDLGTVAAISGDIQTLADIEDGTVATNAISGLAAISADVTTAAGISGNITTVAGISANVTTVAGISANVTTVAGDSADIQALGPVSSNIQALGPISANITTVAGVSANVTTVATNIANVNTCATNIADIQTASNLISTFEVNVVGNAGASASFSVADGNYHTVTLDQNSTFDLQAGSLTSFIIYLEITNGGAYTITWADTIAWHSNTVPTLLASGKNLLAFITTDGGTNWIGIPVWDES